MIFLCGPKDSFGTVRMKTKDIWQLEGICGTIIFESRGRSGAEKKCRKRKNERWRKKKCTTF